MGISPVILEKEETVKNSKTLLQNKERTVHKNGYAPVSDKKEGKSSVVN